MSGLPVIDIAPLAKSGGTAALAREIGDACHAVGFMIVRGHGIAPATVSRMRDAVVGFFGQPLEYRRGWSITKDNYRGYIPLGFFTPNAAGVRPDLYEGYKLHFEVNAADPVCAECPIYGPNKWPDRPPGFRHAVLGYWAECDRVTTLLLDALAMALGISPGVFRRAFVKPLTNMTLLHYPPQSAAGDGFGIHPHKDTDALTILAPDPVGGLEVKRAGSDDWIPADAPDDALIVNVGDMLELWSGGYFRSTPHKVVNASGRERYSFPYFAVPRHDTVVEPLCPAQPGFRRDPVHVGDISAEVWRTNWPDATPLNPDWDLGTL